MSRSSPPTSSAATSCSPAPQTPAMTAPIELHGRSTPKVGCFPSTCSTGWQRGDASVGGLSEADYHLAPGERSPNRSPGRGAGYFRRGAASPPSSRRCRKATRRPERPESGGSSRCSTNSARDGCSRRRPSRSRARLPRLAHVGHIPIHLVGCRDVARPAASRRARGGDRKSPQHGPGAAEPLGRLPVGLLSNGRQLRVLRDNVSLTRQAYLEFDLETIFGNEIYDEFVVLWLDVPREPLRRRGSSGVAGWSGGSPRRRRRARARSTPCEARSRPPSRILGRGFLAYPDNHELRERLRDGELEHASTTTASSCDSSTGSYSCSWPRTGDCCSTPSSTEEAQRRYIELLQPGPTARASLLAGRAGAHILTCGARSSS